MPSARAWTTHRQRSAPVDDGGYEPHYGDEEEYDRHRVDVKH